MEGITKQPKHQSLCRSGKALGSLDTMELRAHWIGWRPSEGLGHGSHRDFACLSSTKALGSLKCHKEKLHIRGWRATLPRLGPWVYLVSTWPRGAGSRAAWHRGCWRCAAVSMARYEGEGFWVQIHSTHIEVQHGHACLCPQLCGGAGDSWESAWLKYPGLRGKQRQATRTPLGVPVPSRLKIKTCRRFDGWSACWMPT